MGKYDQILQQVLLGRADANLAFRDLRGLLRALVPQQAPPRHHGVWFSPDAAPMPISHWPPRICAIVGMTASDLTRNPSTYAALAGAVPFMNAS